MTCLNQHINYGFEMLRLTKNLKAYNPDGIISQYSKSQKIKILKCYNTKTHNTDI